MSRVKPEVDALDEEMKLVTLMGAPALLWESIQGILDTGRLLVSFLQVVPSVVSIFSQVQWPSTFAVMMAWLGIFRLDILGMLGINCIVQRSHWNNLICIGVGT